jgi:hypothetical protein
MAEIEKIMNISTGDIEKIMNIAIDDIEKVMGLEIPVSAVWTGTRGVLAGGDAGNAGYSNVIDYKTVSSTGAMSDFGDLSVTGGIGYVCAASNGTRGVFLGGYSSSGGSAMYNNIQYITVATTNDTTDAGDLTQAKSDGVAASNGTNGYYFAGNILASWAELQEIDYWAIATTNSASDFGDLDTLAVDNQGGAINDATYALRYKGITSASTWGNKYIDYITMASLGNTTDFGDMTVVGGQGLGGCEDTTRGVNWSGRDSGGTDTNVIDYVTIATTSDATDFGNISSGYASNRAGNPAGAGNQASGANAVSNLTKGEVYGGYSQGGPTHDNIDYITIQTPGDATSAGGDLTAVNDQLGALSGT